MIGSDVIGPTDLGTGTAKTLLGGAALVLPAWARSILAVRPTLTIDTVTIAEYVLANITLESDDFSIQPYLALCNPIEAPMTTGAVLSGEPPWYPVNCPINGGDRLKAYGTALTANAGDPRISLQVIMSDKKAGAQLHGKIGTATALGTAAATIVEAAYTLTGGNTLKEILGAVALATPAAPDSVAGVFEFISNDLVDPTPLKLPIHPMCGSVAATAVGSPMTPGLSRAKVEVPIRSPCLFTNQMVETIACSGNGKFITGVLYQ